MERLTAKPLTLEELRKAYDFSERIGAHVLLRVGLSECEGVIDRRDDDGICAVYAAGGEWLKEKDYGKTWVAYAAKLPRLDRSAWQPCEECESCGNCKHGSEHICPFGCSDLIAFEPVGFCKHCGRPLTDAAWDMLEKRLEEQYENHSNHQPERRCGQERDRL